MLIGLHGKKQAGKDTVCERLRHLLGGQGCDVERVSFADKLYESAAEAIGVTVDELRAWKSDPTVRVAVGSYFEDLGFIPTQSQTVREYLQRYGTEAHREKFGDNFWVDNVDLTHKDRIVVVTDVRFPNEAQAVLNAGGAVVHVIGPEEVENAGDGHASEVVLPNRFVDFELYNCVRDDAFHSLDSEVLGVFLQLRREGY